MIGIAVCFMSCREPRSGVHQQTLHTGADRGRRRFGDLPWLETEGTRAEGTKEEAAKVRIVLGDGIFFRGFFDYPRSDIFDDLNVFFFFKNDRSQTLNDLNVFFGGK